MEFQRLGGKETRTMNRINHSQMLSGIAALAIAATLGIQAAKADPRESDLTLQQVATSTLVPGVQMHAPTPEEIQPVSRSSGAIVPPLDITEAEARQWVIDAGYNDVSQLTLAITADGAPVYHGTARAEGKTYSVIVDSWGNIAGWQ
jgi:hypothetical protein